MHQTPVALCTGCFGGAAMVCIGCGFWPEFWSKGALGCGGAAVAYLVIMKKKNEGKRKLIRKLGQKSTCCIEKID